MADNGNNGQGSTAPAAGLPDAISKGFNSLFSNLNVGFQSMLNAQAQVFENFSRSVQQTQSTIVNNLNQTMGNLTKPLQAVQQGGQIAPPPMIPAFQQKKEEKKEEPKAEWSPDQVVGKTLPSTKDYKPLTENRQDFTKGGFKASPDTKGMSTLKTTFF